jgi:hypothetical protein
MMLGVFVDLTWWSLRNRFRARLRRLREPRYILGALFALLWLGSVLIRPRHHGATPPVGAAPLRPHVSTIFEMLMVTPDTARFGVAIALLALALLMIWWPGGRRPLEFTPAEVQLLFPAPITRRQLLHYKLLRGQGGLLFSSAIATLMLRPTTLRDGWRFSLGFWLVITVGRLFSIAVGLAAGERRTWRPLLVVSIVAAAVLAIAGAPAAGRIAALEGWGPRLEALRAAWSSLGPRVVLWPFATLANLPLAGSGAAFWAGLPGVLALIGVTYAWVLQTDAAFEEAAAARAEKPSSRALAAQPRVSRRGAPFLLALEGPPETAILWKNLILLGRYASVRTLLRILPFVIAFLPMGFGMGMAGKKGTPGAAVLMTAACMAAGMVLLIGPGTMRNDLRDDLRRLALLKTWPVSGQALVRGELLAPTLVLSVIACLPIIVAAFAFGGLPAKGPVTALLGAHRASFAVAGLLIAPALVLAQLVVQNGLAVLLPAWLVTKGSAGAGLERMGQSLVVVWGGWLAAIAFVVPGALVGWTVRSLLTTAMGPAAVIPAAGALLAFVIGEALLATSWLGRVLDRTDLQSLDPVE